MADAKPPFHTLSPGLPVEATPAIGVPPNQEAETQGGLGLRRWFHRLLILLFVFSCAVVGVLLVILPWRAEWTDNHFVVGYPALREMLGQGFVRGVCSGLGVLDVWIGFWEAIHYQEDAEVRK
jgi:hypothetical protein